MAIDLFKLVHAYHMPGRRFGSDAGLILLWGACLVLYIESGQPVNASRLSRYIGMPNETVRRHLAKLADLRLVKREGYKFRPKVAIEDDRVEEAERRFWRAANKLYKKPIPQARQTIEA